MATFTTESHTARYAWVITQDLDNPYNEDPDGLALPTRVGLSGPSQATEEQVLRALRTGAFFRLRDDDANTYYIGHCWYADGPGSRWARAVRSAGGLGPRRCQRHRDPVPGGRPLGDAVNPPPPPPGRFARGIGSVTGPGGSTPGCNAWSTRAWPHRR